MPVTGAGLDLPPVRQSATPIEPTCSWEAPLRSTPQKHPSYWTNILGGMGKSARGPRRIPRILDKRMRGTKGLAGMTEEPG